MDKAILKTLLYGELFDFPLTIREIHKWLISKKSEPRKVESALGKLLESKIVKKSGPFYFLKGKEALVNLRRSRAKVSYIYIRKVKMLAIVLKIIPWIKLLGISGGLSMGNAGKVDDIDFFVVTAKNRLWLSRFFLLGILSLVGERRTRSDNKKSAAGKICCNIILEEDKLEQENKDLYTAHEVLQMKVLWQRDGIYSKYLSDNEWAFEYLPNWVSGSRPDLRFKNYDLRNLPKSYILNPKSFLAGIENFARKIQLNIMSEKKGMERIGNGSLYFHPNDYRIKVLNNYRKRIATLDKNSLRA